MIPRCTIPSYQFRVFFIKGTTSAGDVITLSNGLKFLFNIIPLCHQCCLPSTEAIDRREKIHACVWRFKVASFKRASLKSTRVLQNKKFEYFCKRVVYACMDVFCMYVPNVVSYIKIGSWGECLGPRGMRMGNGEDSTLRNFIVCTFHLI